MNKVYILVPLIGVALFSVFYFNFTKKHDAAQAQLRVEAEAKKKEKAAKELAAREQAIKDAVAAAERRKAEKAERDRIEEAKKTAKQEAEDKRVRAAGDRTRLKEQAARLKKEVEELKGQLTKLDETKQNYLKEQAFLKEYTKQARSNVKYYQDLLDKLDAAEKAKIEAEKAAAAAKKS